MSSRGAPNHAFGEYTGPEPVDIGIPMYGAKYIIAGKELYLGDITYDVHDNVQLTFYRAADLPTEAEVQERKRGLLR